MGRALNRAAMKEKALARREPWDLIVIGGGATGAGVAVDAATRGYSVLLLEQHDFGKGTSSRSTKLVHGGVRYLEQGNISLVIEALRERGQLLRNAPHLVRVQPFIVPTYAWWEAPFYGIGLKLYDLLAWGDRFGPSRYLPRREVQRRLPTIQAQGLRGGILYHDGLFDDARLLINLMQTAAEAGAVVLNYVRVIGFTQHHGTVLGVVARDEETGAEFEAVARVVVNATGAFCDDVRRMADSAAQPMVAPSQGTHLVFDRSFLPCDTALMVPKTRDGRVMFAIPWHGHTLVGTTDVAIPNTSLEPRATESEVEFLLETAGRYLAKPPTRADVRSVFVGIRPLVRVDGTANTAKLSRDHTLRVDRGGLITITGGKWTTYRNMAEDCVNLAAKQAGLTPRRCITNTHRIHGYREGGGPADPLAIYGADAAAIRELQRAKLLHPALPYTEAEVIWAARHEMARTVEDVLARRTRALIVNATAARAAAPRVAELLAAELAHDAAWPARQVAAFQELAQGYGIPKA